MFSSNLQRNILQLDRRISVLENECFNMELDKKKKKNNNNNKKDVPAPIRPKQSNSKSSDISVKSSSSSRNITKICVEGNNKIKKISPSARVRSTHSAPFHGGKPSNLNNGMSLVENKANICENQNKKSLQSHQCHCTSHSRALIHCDGPCGNCCRNGCSSNNSNGELKSMSSNKCSGDAEKDSVVHKEVFYTNQNGSIEVTVKQKSNLRNQQEREFLNDIPVKEIKNIETECCKCHCYKKKSLGQKWSDILSLDCGCHNEGSRKVVPKNILNSVDLISISESQDRRHHKPPASDSNVSYKFDQFKMGRLLMSNREINRNDSEQKREEGSNGKSGMDGTNDGRKNPSDGSSLSDPEKPTETLKNSLCQGGVNPGSDIFTTIQKLCDNLIKEKDTLTREVATKNSIIERMKKREEDFVSLIDSLKMSLNKIKCGAKANLDAENELKIAKDKLSEQGKVIDSLRRGHIRLKEMLAKSTLEKDRLQTEIQIYKLESQKHDVLMAGKEAEIKRYKQEIGNFQRQISEHLACLKSNSQVLDLRKMMEAIIHQSRIFGRDDLDAGAADLPPNDDSKDLSKCHNGLMHSSPTSTKASDVNSSWREISSIKTQDAKRAEYVQDAGDKGFIQVYGGEGSITRHHSKVLPKKSQDSIAFTSCLSATAKKEEGNEPGEQAWTAASSDNVKNGIDRLLQGIKLKWSEEVYKVPTSGNDTIEDFLNGTLASSICE